MRAEEARRLAEKHFNLDEMMEGIYETIEHEACENGKVEFTMHLRVSKKSLLLIMNHLEAKGYKVTITHFTREDGGLKQLRISW